MEVLTVKIKGNGLSGAEYKIIGYIVNGTIRASKDDNDPYYKAVKAWELLGNTPEPEFTQAELDKQAADAKWNLVNTGRSSLTVTTAAGNKFAANQEAILSIYRKEASMLSGDSCTWYEDWGPFTVTKVELQDALNRANAADQELLDTLLA